MNTISLSEYINNNLITNYNLITYNNLYMIREFDLAGKCIFILKFMYINNKYYAIDNNEYKYNLCFALQVNKMYYIIYYYNLSYDILILAKFDNQNMYRYAFLSWNMNEVIYSLKKNKRSYLIKYYDVIKHSLTALYNYSRPYILLYDLG